MHLVSCLIKCLDEIQDFKISSGIKSKSNLLLCRSHHLPKISTSWVRIPEQNNFGLELILYYFSRAESCQTLAIFNLDPFSNAQRLIFWFRKKKIHFWRTSISGAAIAQWILLYLLCYPGFESQAHHLCFNFFVEFVLYWSCEKNGIKQKGPGLAHLKSQFLLKLYNLWAATLIIFWVFWN